VSRRPLVAERVGMTVCVAIKVYDGIVFAADSAVTTSITDDDGNPIVWNVWNHGLKVFNLHGNTVAMAAGLGSFGPVSVTSLAKRLHIELAKDLELGCPVKEVVRRAHGFFECEYQKIGQSPKHSFEFWIGGYGDKEHSEIWKVNMFDGEFRDPVQIIAGEGEQIIWGGEIRAISRLLLGIDPILHNSLLEREFRDEQGQAIDLRPLLSGYQTPLVDGVMPIQDAIDLADFLVSTTKRYVAFLPGANTVGGDADIATVTRYEGFKWIRRKHYYPHDLNRRTDKHAADPT